MRVESLGNASLPSGAIRQDNSELPELERRFALPGCRHVPFAEISITSRCILPDALLLELCAKSFPMITDG